MWDIVVGIGVLVAETAGMLWAGRWAARRLPRWASDAMAAAAVVLLLVFALFVYGKLFLARYLPWSNVLIVGNGFPLLASFAVGIVAATAAIPRWRRASFGLLLMGLAWCSVFAWVVNPRPLIAAPRHVYGFCAQTSASSCSACCAAALLREYEIRSSEAEMVRLCLTTTAGTPELGLYRGLSLKARQAGHTVDVFRGTMDELRRPSNWPILLLVSMQASNRSEFRPWWHPGRAEDHAIVLYGFRDDGRIDVGDPIAGRTTITEEELAGRWRGLGLRLRPASAN